MTGGGLARPQIAVGVLGNVSLHIDGRPVELRGERVRTLLAVLALSAGDSLPTTVIAERVWGDDPPANIGPSLHTLMTRLRRAVGVDLVSTGSAGYSLRIDPDDVDALRFSRLLRSAAQAGDADQEHALIVEAMSLWAGQPFEGIRSAWLESGEAPRLVEQYLAAIERRVDLRVDDRQYGEVLAELRELTTTYPLCARTPPSGSARPIRPRTPVWHGNGCWTGPSTPLMRLGGSSASPTDSSTWPSRRLLGRAVARHRAHVIRRPADRPHLVRRGAARADGDGEGRGGPRSARRRGQPRTVVVDAPRPPGQPGRVDRDSADLR